MELLPPTDSANDNKRRILKVGFQAFDKNKYEQIQQRSKQVNNVLNDKRKNNTHINMSLSVNRQYFTVKFPEALDFQAFATTGVSSNPTLGRNFPDFKFLLQVRILVTPV